MARQLFEYDPVAGYRFIPGLKARIDHEGGGYFVHTNGSGFRCAREFESAKREGVCRALLFGDSFTAGDGVSNRDRYGDVLETLVPGLEIYNFGLPGSGTDQQYLLHRELAGRFDHDLVIVAVLVENIRRVAARYRPYVTHDGRELVMAKPYFELSGGALVLHNVPAPRDPVEPSELGEEGQQYVDTGGRFRVLREAVNLLGPAAKDVAQRITGYQPLPAYDSPTSPDWLLMKAILKRWFEEARVPVLLFPMPLYQHIEGTSSPDAYRARFRELDQPPRVVLHDPLPDLQRASREERRAFRFKHDVHPTPSGHRALAQSLAPLLASFVASSGRPPS